MIELEFELSRMYVDETTHRGWSIKDVGNLKGEMSQNSLKLATDRSEKKCKHEGAHLL